MKPAQRNLMVGIFVLIGLVILGVLIAMFGELLQMMRPGYVVTVHLDNASRITVGKKVHKNGLIVGEVMELTVAPLAKPGVLVSLRISRDVDIPNDAELLVTQTSMGTVFLDIPVGQQQRGVPVPKDGKAVLRGRRVPFSLVPPGMMEEFKALGALVANLTDLTEPRTPEQVRASEGRLRPNFSTVLHGIDAIVNDTQNQKSIRDGLAKIGDAASALEKTLREAGKFLLDARKFAASADETVVQWKKTGSSMEKVSEQIGELVKKIRAESTQASRTLERIDEIVANVQKGKGTIGKLLTDDKLYNALWTNSEDLSQTLREAKKLFIIWQTKGILAKEK
ncbi:MAG: MlaD family protein [Planctomycetia bacterium]|nr:MlaD family protein [Planctomycetia bacterium]